MSAPKNARTAALEALIDAHAVELKLPTVRRRFRTLAEEAVREQQTPVAYLAALLETEMAERAERREKRRLIDARFPAHKTLEDFDFTAQPSAERPLVMHLAQLAWIEEHANVCLIGPPAPAKPTSRPLCRSAPASKADACGSPRSPHSRTNSKKRKAAKSSPASSVATPEPSSSA